MDMDTSQKIFSSDSHGMIPFDEFKKNFTRDDLFHCTMSSTKIKNQEQFMAFSHDLEDLMRKHGVYQVMASIFADL